jgi:hypothetical protein
MEKPLPPRRRRSKAKPAQPAKEKKPKSPAVPAAPSKPAREPEAPPKGKAPNAPLKTELQLFYDIRDGSYISLLNGRYVGMNKADIQLRFKAQGLRDDFYIPTKLGSLREIDFPFHEAQDHRMIDYAGPIAGRRVGVFEDSAKRKFLVTDEPAGVWAPLIPKAAPKFFPAFIEELLPGDQADAFCFWLAESIRSLRAIDFSPGQACFFFGAPRCGKSFNQYCITELFGGRAANPFEYLMGEKFNKDLIGAEHWMMEDPKNSTRADVRRDFGEGIKEATVNRDIRVRAMCKDATLLQIFRRITGSMNDEKESIASAPPMVQGVKDKINLFHCNVVTKAFEPFKDGNGKVDRAKLWKVFMGEVHAIRSWLLQRFGKVPRTLADERFGIQAYHNAEILSELASMTYEARFLELVDEKYFSNPDEVWQPIEMGSSAWQKILQDFNRFEADKIFRYINQCGSHLSKLWKQGGEVATGDLNMTNYRVSKRILDGNALWTIIPPSKTSNK